MRRPNASPQARTVMLKNYLTVALRTLRRQKGYAFINIFGLALGLACCILALLFVYHEVTYDAFHHNVEAIYTVKARFNDFTFDSTPDPLMPALVDAYPEVDGGVRLWDADVVVRSGQDVFQESLLFADSTFFEMFTFPLAQGDPATALAEPQSLVLSDEAARKYFPDGDALGNVLPVYLGAAFHDFRVTGVAAPLPGNSSLRFDFLAPYRSTFLIREESLETAWLNYGVTSFVRLAGPDYEAQEKALAAKLPTFIDQYMGDALREDGDKVEDYGFTFEAFANYHLGAQGSGSGLEESGDPASVYLLTGIALLVLLIACFNFMNLSIGQTASRFREIGMRKVLGARRRQLIRQFWLEAVFLSVLALLLGLTLAELFLPVFNATAGTALTLTFFETVWFLPALLGLAVLTGLAAGSYPALLLSGLRSTEVFKGKLRIGGRTLLTRTFIVVQFLLSIVLLISTLLMQHQQDFMMNRALGFDQEQVVVLPTQVDRTNRGEGEVILNVFKNELAGRPNIIQVSGTSNSFGRGTSASLITTEDGTPHTVFEYRVDYAYLETLGLTLAEGRNFSPDFPEDLATSILVNEAFVRTFAETYGIDNPIGFTLPREFAGIEQPRIAGVVQDYHFQSLHAEIYPALLHLNPSSGVQYVLVKIAPVDVPATLALLERTWQALRPNQPFEYHFLDDDVAQQYENETRWSRAISYASAFALVLACLGLLGLTALSVARRTKEIGIRKVLGASVLRLVYLLSKEFVLLVLVANLFAWPLAYLAAQRWLEHFAYRIAMSWQTFLMAGLAALLVALLTVSFQSIKAALADPVKSLRYE